MATRSDLANVTLLVPLRPPYHCPACLPVYRDYVDHGGLSRHLRRVHGGHLNFECRACHVQSEKLKEIKLHQARSTNCAGALPPMSPNHTCRDPKPRGRIPTGARRRNRSKDYGLDEAYLASQSATNNEVSASHHLSPESPPAVDPVQVPPASVSPANMTCTPPRNNDDPNQPPEPAASPSSPPLVRRPRRRTRQRRRRTSNSSTASPTTTGPSTLEPPPDEPAATVEDIHPLPPPAVSIPEEPPPEPDTTDTNAEPPAWVIAWRNRFDCALDEDMLEAMVNDLSNLAKSMIPQPTRHQRPRHNRPQRNQHYNHRSDANAAAASRIQRLYRANRSKAFDEITRGPGRYCNIDKTTLEEHFTSVYGLRQVPQEPLVNLLPPPPQPTTSDPLSAAFTPSEVAKRLARCHNTAPGPDHIRYYIWRRLDPQGHILAALFNAIRRTGHIPESWRTSTTILLHKKGDQSCTNNWRPIALANTLGKIYSACVANRLLLWCEENNIISSAQKGFMRFEGCSEHSFVLQSTIQDARRRNRECHVAWLDLANAFGSVPHNTILTCLRWCGLDPSSIDCIESLLKGCHTSIRTSSGYTNPIPICAGVKQGCPLSPILFNLVIEPALRLINNLQHGYQLHDQAISILAYADDVTIVSNSTTGLQAQLDLLSTWAQCSGLAFNPSKCATLSVASKYRCATNPSFTIQESSIPQLGKNDYYQHLGVPTGFSLGKSAEAIIDDIISDLKRIDNSRLAPWQKIDCVSTFLTSRLTFHLTVGNVQKRKLSILDKHIKRSVKRWMYLPQRASPELIYMPHGQGGANITPCNLLADVAQVSHAVHLLLSRDTTVSALAFKTLRLVVEKRIKRLPTDADLCTYLAGSMANEFGCDPYDIPSVWTRLRMATRRLKKRIDINWTPNNDGTLIPIINGRPINKNTAAKSISAAVRESFLGSLLNKPDQGKAYKIIATNHHSNHFLREGNFTRFADWRFIHRARLSVVPLRGLRRFGNASQTCRKCRRQRETLAHVINHCPPNFRMITMRHNAILERLNNSFNHRNLTVYSNQQIPDFPSSCRPDLVVLNSNPKTATIVDVATPFENGADAFHRARTEKINKYTDLANHFRSQGYDTFIDAFVVGALGGYDAANEGILQRLGVNRNYAKLMKKLMVSDCIRFSRDIYANHLSNHQRN
ncbi:uncharacterized protein LOC111626755 [Centruroides sculpturatus]|uniref:uncharacterized protein LOC111626755 n=1 Tax=Centruroides sculpturatus TaxID=218467 RepID=UPI000C6E6032|nr:uncharacterized protein LOC111626755 [Centruroides sculpturatus]